VAALQLSPAQRNHLLFTFCRLHTCASAVDTAQRFGIVEPAGFPLDQLFVPDSATAARLLERTLPSGSEPLVHEHFATKGPTDPYLKQWDVARRLVAAVPFDGGRKYVAFVLRVDGFALAVGTKARSHEVTSFDSLPAEGKVPPKIPGRENEEPHFVGPTGLAPLYKRKGADRVPLWTPLEDDSDDCEDDEGEEIDYGAWKKAQADRFAAILAPAAAFHHWALTFQLLGTQGAIATADIPGVARLLALAHNHGLALIHGGAAHPHTAPRSEQPASVPVTAESAAALNGFQGRGDAGNDGVTRSLCDRPAGPAGPLAAHVPFGVSSQHDSPQGAPAAVADIPASATARISERHPDVDLFACVQFRFRTEFFAIPASLVGTCPLNTLVVVQGDRGNRAAADAVDAGRLVAVTTPHGHAPLPTQRVLRKATDAEVTRRGQMDERAEHALGFVRNLQRTTLQHWDFGRADVRACEFQLDGLKLFVHFYSDKRITFKPVAAAIRDFHPIEGFYVCMKYMGPRPR